MPYCIDCGKGQTKLNDGLYCKSCKPGKGLTDDVVSNGMNEYCENFVKNADSTDDSNDFWGRMDELLDKKLLVQEKRIKDAVLTEVTGKIKEITTKQEKLEEDNKKIVAENKKLIQKIATLETRQKNLEELGQKTKRVVNMQQGYIVQQDRAVRQKRLLICGLSETEPLKYAEEVANTDWERVEMIFKALNLSLDILITITRIGSPDQGPGNKSRYLMIEIKDKESRIKVKESSNKLHNIEELKHIRMKADLTKRDREEYSRLFKLKETLEKDNPEKTVRYEKGKIIMENETVDEFKSASQIF